jgi:adenylylsulfate kinase-like enzyme
MKWEKDTAADIVMGAAAKIAEDMVHGAAAAIQDMTRYHSVFKNMEHALNRSADNLRHHLLKKKWMSKEDRQAIRNKITQIRAIARVCMRLQDWCAGYATGSISELKKMEVNKKLARIVSRIESDTED